MFGIGYNIKSKVRECTPELLDKVLDSSSVAKTCAELEDALERCRRGELTKEEYETLKGELKKLLPVATFHATFKHGRRKNDEAIPSGLSIYDIDHIPNPRAKWEEIAPRKEELGIVMAHITPSTEGLRLVFVIPTAPGTNRLMSLAEAQAWMASMLGDTTYDVCVKDYARCSFLVPREYVLFLSEGLFKTTGVILRNEETKNLETQSGCIQILRDAQDDKDNVPQDDKMGGGPQDDKDNVPQDDKTGGGRGNNTPTYPETYENIPYTKIVETLEEQMGGRPEHGSRNNFIFSMACHLRYICDDDPDWIATILPTYGEAREKWMASIRSACARNQTRSFPNIMRRTLKIAQSGCTQILRDAQNDTGVALPPEMPTNLPPLIELLVSRTPDIYKPAVAHAVFPALGAHLWRTTFRYIDNVHHEATLMNVLMAGTGAGKNCITEPVNRILADIRRRDKENMLREKAWKKEMQSMGANKNKRQRPEGLVIQEIDPDMTNAAFVQRLADADGKFLYTKMNEIDQFDALKTSANRKSQFQIMCLAFDPGNVYGQTRIGTGSVTERVCIRFNWNASTTIQKGQAYFRSVLTDGPISRINFCTIPEREIGAPMPVYGSYDEEFDRELATYIERLNAVRGEVECPEAFALAQTLSEECAEFARLSQSRVYENLSFRANVIAYLRAMVLYVAHGEEWSREIEDFVRWSLQYDMWCKMAFFAESIEETEGNNTSHHTRKGPQNLLDLLPKVFTYEDAAQVKQRVTGQSGSPKAMLNNWIRRGYIEIYGETHPAAPNLKRYIKTSKYLETHTQSA